MAAQKVLVYGGKGALGSTIVKYFKAKNWWVSSIDLHPNEDADVNVLIDPSTSWTAQEEVINTKMAEALAGKKLDAILCVAGGWAGGNAASKDLVKNSDLMWKQSVWSSVIAAHVAANHLKQGGLLALTGAQPALEGTAGMIGYGMAKAAVHQLVKSLAASDGGLPSDAFVSAILPVTLDTPMNRKWMGDADQTKWTPLDTVAALFYNWSQGKERPVNGSLVQLFTADGSTKYIPA